ncbi:hypothetical protein ACIBI0_34135 [Microbispora rosea]|uniref:hypothetical protein n=1 Tax=Microbispora rosea TaxID=58117 RepID=UPI00379558B2
MTVTATALPAATPPAVPQAGGTARPAQTAPPAVTPTPPTASTAGPTSPGSPVWELPAQSLTGGSAAVPPPAGGQPPTAPIVIPGYLPLPPLVAHVHDRCGDDGTAGCWSLAPWRSRTSGHSPEFSAGERTSGTATPRWAFAPPSVKSGVPSPPSVKSGVPGAFSAPFAGSALAADESDAARAGCWAFSPSAHCARWD